MDPVPNGSQPGADRWHGLSAVDRRDVVRSLRQRGRSYGEIAGIVPVPKSTVATWCHDIVLTDVQRRAIEVRRGAASRQGVSVDTQWRRRVEIRAVRADAARYAVAAVSDPLFVAGVCLYWAEGSKTRNDCSITNSDPNVLRIFIGFVRNHLDPCATFALALNLHGIAAEEASKRYWRTELELPAARFTKSYVKQPGTGHRRNRLPHGICRVRVDRSSNHWHRMMVWIDAVARTLPT